MTGIRVVELRQYTLRPGRRDTLIELFDREFVESQEAVGMAVLGQFRDLDDPDRFVWLRGFAGLPDRARSLAAFYGGPVWRAHSAEANATMIDSDDVLLLHPVPIGQAFPWPPSRGGAGVFQCHVYLGERPFDAAFAAFVNGRIRPLLTDAGADGLACFQTEYAENAFPALPVREGEHAFVWFARFAGRPRLDALPVPPAALIGEQRLVLSPTARSHLR